MQCKTALWCNCWATSRGTAGRDETEVTFLLRKNACMQVPKQDADSAPVSGLVRHRPQRGGAREMRDRRQRPSASLQMPG